MNSFAQINDYKTLYKPNSPLQKSITSYLVEHHSIGNTKNVVSYINLKHQSNKEQLSRLKNFNSNLTLELPFFCYMECKLHKQINLWIKLRTGNDDSYTKLIK